MTDYNDLVFRLRMVFGEGIGDEVAREMEKLRAELVECRAFMNRYAVHQITCNRNPCTCGLDDSWPTARKGEGEK